MKKKVMLSQPMAGKTTEEIVEVRDKAIKYLEKSGFQVVDTYFPNDSKYLNVDILSKPLFSLGKSLMYMSYCDAVYFCNGWENARGFRIEHDAAVAYGLEVIEE